MSSRLAELARSGSAARAAEQDAELEHCDLCGEPIPGEHRHLLDLATRQLQCVCQACRILFDRREAGMGHYVLVPERRLLLQGFRLDDALWDQLSIPVGIAFFLRGGPGEIGAYYPGPAGPTESLLALDAWAELERRNPMLATLAPDVEALLVNRARGARQHFLVPVEDPYRLVALIRTRWRGLSGGREVWEEIDGFFAALTERAEKVNPDGEEAPWGP